MLTGLCTNRVPSARLLAPDLRDRFDWIGRQRYRERHLPQGAPTSPALANLSAFRFDMRLAALARSLGATYTRYADDLAFSGGGTLARDVERLQIRVAAIALEEGFALQLRKTRVMRRGTRQQLAGVVVNRHPNLARDAFDLLKAILTNCIRSGPASQNRDAHPDFRAHLAGRVAHAAALNAARGAKAARAVRPDPVGRPRRRPVIRRIRIDAGRRHLQHDAEHCYHSRHAAPVPWCDAYLPQPFAVPSTMAGCALPARSCSPLIDARRRLVRIAQAMPAPANDSDI